ncbi:MAG: DUF5655 domain-containing protein [Ilumatobacteraceae bacterium]
MNAEGMWECPRCERRFGQANRPHVCVPAMAIDAYFVDSDPADRGIYDAVAGVLTQCGPVEIEAVSVGILFKRSRTFVELRPRKRGMACSMILPQPIESARVTRRVPVGSRGVANFVPVLSADDVDDELCGWLAMAYDAASSRTR